MLKSTLVSSKNYTAAGCVVVTNISYVWEPKEANTNSQIQKYTIIKYCEDPMEEGEGGKRL